MSSSVKDLRAVFARRDFIRSFAVETDGVQVMADTDLRLLALADSYSRSAAGIRRRQRERAELLALTGETYTPDQRKLQQAADLALKARQIRDIVRGFALDREDRVLERGRFATRMMRAARKGTPKVMGGPVQRTVVRSFNSANEMRPESHWYCTNSDCGAIYTTDQNETHIPLSKARRDGSRFFCRCCGNELRHDWSQLPEAERFIAAHCRGRGAGLAEDGGSSVEYRKHYDENGVWTGTDTVQGVGIEPLLRVEDDLCAIGYPMPDRAAAVREDVRRDRAQDAQNMADDLHRANSLGAVLHRQDDRARYAAVQQRVVAAAAAVLANPGKYERVGTTHRSSASPSRGKRGGRKHRAV